MITITGSQRTLIREWLDELQELDRDFTLIGYERQRLTAQEKELRNSFGFWARLGFFVDKAKLAEYGYVRINLRQIDYVSSANRHRRRLVNNVVEGGIDGELYRCDPVYKHQYEAMVLGYEALVLIRQLLARISWAKHGPNALTPAVLQQVSEQLPELRLVVEEFCQQDVVEMSTGILGSLRAVESNAEFDFLKDTDLGNPDKLLDLVERQARLLFSKFRGAVEPLRNECREAVAQTRAELTN